MSPPPRLQFDEGSRIMEEGAADLRRTSNTNEEEGNTHSLSGLSLSSPSSKEKRRTIRPETDDIAIYFEIERSCREIVRGLNLDETSLDGTIMSKRQTSFSCRVALQFPDELLGDATEVCWMMEQGLSNEITAATRRMKEFKQGQEGKPSFSAPSPLVFILGDTTHGACCVDVVAAQHLQADWIVHYGRACLTPISVSRTTKKIPVTYVFGRGNPPLNILDCATRLKDYLNALKTDQLDEVKNNSFNDYDQKLHLAVLYDLPYHYAIEDLHSILSRLMGDEMVSRAKDGSDDNNVPALQWNIHISQLPSEVDSPITHSRAQLYGAKASDAEEEGTCPDRSKNQSLVFENQKQTIVIGGLQINLSDEVSLSDCAVVYIGNQSTAAEERHLMNILLRCTSSGDISPRWCCVYEPSTCTLTADINKLCRRTIQRRFYCVQKAKTARVFGIVVGTLALDGFQQVVSKLQHLIEEESGRTCYIFSVGKLNPAKLGNFGDIVECFVLVNCPENSLLDDELSKEYPIPIITPLECAMALGSREWDGFYSLDCIRDYLTPELRRERKSEASNHDDDAGTFDSDEGSRHDKDRPFFDVTTGKYVTVVGHGAKRNNASIENERTSTQSETPKDLDRNNKLTTETLVVAKNENDQQLMTFPTSAAVELFKKREYQGLRAQIGQTPVVQAVPGQKGIASMYNSVPPEKNIQHAEEVGQIGIDSSLNT